MMSRKLNWLLRSVRRELNSRYLRNDTSHREGAAELIDHTIRPIVLFAIRSNLNATDECHGNERLESLMRELLAAKGGARRV